MIILLLVKIVKSFKSSVYYLRYMAPASTNATVKGTFLRTQSYTVQAKHFKVHEIKIPVLLL